MKKIYAFISFLILIVLLSSCASGSDNNSASASTIPSAIVDTTAEKKATQKDSQSGSDNSSDATKTITQGQTTTVQSSTTEQKTTTAKSNKEEQSVTQTKTTASKSTTQKPTSATKTTATTSAKPTATSPKSDNDKITVSVSIDCKTAVEAGYSIASKVSNNGVILSSKKITLKKGSSVYDALKATDLIVGSSSTAMGAYVYSINSLAEKDCGSASGWIYFVNGEFIPKSCDKYILNGGEKIAWRYTCNNGKDF